MKKCLGCDNQVDDKRTYCSHSCSNKNRWKKDNIDRRKRDLELNKNRVCKNCSRKIESWRTYCSVSCKTRDQWSTTNLREIMSKGMLNKWSDLEFQQTHSRRMRKLHQDPEYRSRMVGGKSGNRGWYSSPKAGVVLYRSSWELEAYKLLDSCNTVSFYETEPFSINYLIDGIEKSYFPDILITYFDGYQELVEIKPLFQLKDLTNQAKIRSGLDYAFKNSLGFKIWTERNWPL
jgi:hypothetical protein